MNTVAISVKTLAHSFVKLAREIYQTHDFIPLHAPCFIGNEKKYVLDTIDSTFVSSVGEYVSQFEQDFAAYLGAKYAVAMVNGTAALHIALHLHDVGENDLVITQPLSFVATCNAIRYCQAEPLFIDVDRDSLSLSPEKLHAYLETHAEVRESGCYLKNTNKRVSACVPMHTFGLPAKMPAIKKICDQYKLILIEDAAEALGSTLLNKHVGLVGHCSTFSFNGNKILTTGGGGMLVTDDSQLAQRAKHLSTTAKITHAWHYDHNELGFNYRLPNLNAALGVAQLEQLPIFIQYKRALADRYAAFFSTLSPSFVAEREHCYANYWLNAILLKDVEQRDQFLTETNAQQVMTRPVWRLLNELPMYQHCLKSNLDNAKWLAERLVNIPSGVHLT